MAVLLQKAQISFGALHWNEKKVYPNGVEYRNWYWTGECIKDYYVSFLYIVLIFFNRDRRKSKGDISDFFWNHMP